MAGAVDAIQSKVMADASAACARWTEDNPEVVEKDGKRTTRKIAPSRGYIEKQVRLALDASKLESAFVDDLVAALHKHHNDGNKG